MNKYKLGNEICRLRESRGLTQNELAKALEVTDKAVSKWENGQAIPRMDKFELLSEALGTSIEYLIAVAKDNSSVVFIENDYATTLHLDIDGQPVSIGEDGKWVEVNPNGFTMKIKGDFDFDFIDDMVKEENSLKDKLLLKVGKKAVESISSMALIANCTYIFRNVADGENINIKNNTITYDTRLAVFRQFAVMYPDIDMKNGSAELIKATASNKKQYVKSFRREAVWSDLGLGFIWMILEAPFINMYLNHLCKDEIIKKRILKRKCD